jgi:hypothetical protein
MSSITPSTTLPIYLGEEKRKGSGWGRGSAGDREGTGERTEDDGGEDTHVREMVSMVSMGGTCV